MEIEIVQATFQHAIDLAPLLRESDAIEVMASGGSTPLEALAGSVNASTLCWTALLDGCAHIMWGAAQADRGTDSGQLGIVWLLSSEEMYKIKGRFIRESHRYVNEMFETFDTLFNYVHAVNISSQQWLERLGFLAIKRYENYGIGNQPFILYARSNHV